MSKPKKPLLVTIELKNYILARLQDIAEHDFRTIDQEISWLINREFEARHEKEMDKLSEEA